MFLVSDVTIFFFGWKVLGWSSWLFGFIYIYKLNFVEIRLINSFSFNFSVFEVFWLIPRAFRIPFAFHCLVRLVLWLLLIAALSLSNGYYLGPLLLTVQWIWIVLGRCLVFFNNMFSHFHDFWSHDWNSDFGHAETGSGAKKRVVLFCEIFLR